MNPTRVCKSKNLTELMISGNGLHESRAADPDVTRRKLLILSAFCNDIVEDGILLNIHFFVFFYRIGFIGSIKQNRIVRKGILYIVNNPT